jgi:O-antigen/teichoic acid export membrane protein
MIDRTLSWASARFGIDAHYIAKGGFILSLSQVSSAVFSLLLTIAFANLVSIETYGVYRYVLSVYAFISLLSLPGLDVAVTHSVAHGKEGVLSDAFQKKLRWSLVGTAVSLAYAGYELSRGNIALGVSFAIAGAALPFFEATNVYSAFFNGKKMYKEWTVSEVIIQAFSVSSLIATMYVKPALVSLVVAYFAPYIIGKLITYGYALKKRSNDIHDPDAFRYGGSVTIFQYIGRAVASLDQLVIYHFLGPVQLAIFSLANAIPMRIQSLLKISGTLSFPKFAGRSQAEVMQALPRKMALFAAGIMTICIAYVIAAPLIFKYVFPSYMPSLHYSQAIVFFSLGAITYPLSSYFFANKRLKENYVVNFAAFGVKIVTLIALVPIYGVWGAVASILAAAASTIIVSIWLLYRPLTSSNDTSASGPGGFEASA